MELFEDQGDKPLAVRFRPKVLSDVLGQAHILGEGSLLRQAIERDQLTSLILYGPPGCGKTSLAQVIANTTKRRFVTLNAVLSGVKELKEVLESAQQRKRFHGQGTILFVDEVHRWNKAQQDALLPWVEEGTVVLIGATTANPFFELNSALLSRSRVYELRPLERRDLMELVERVLADRERGLGGRGLTLTDGAREALVDVAGGDARKVLNVLEMLNFVSGPNFVVDKGHVLEAAQRPQLRYDKTADAHYDTASAFIKSIRGSDPDAALYWLGVMLESGEDPSFIWRRLLISACEDVGLADPQALPQVEAAAAAFDRVGMPEGRYFLSFATLRLSLAPKSNSTVALFRVLDHLKQRGGGEVPGHLKDSSRDSQGLGHGHGYLYPHDFEGHWVAQQYLPDDLKDVRFYEPGSHGWEKAAGELWSERRKSSGPNFGGSGTLR